MLSWKYLRDDLLENRKETEMKLKIVQNLDHHGEHNIEPDESMVGKFFEFSPTGIRSLCGGRLFILRQESQLQARPGECVAFCEHELLVGD
jgi:hypothetical protein